MKSQLLSVARASYARAPRAASASLTPKYCALFAFWMAFTTLGLSAQSYTEMDLSDFTYAVIGSEGMLDAGDTATYTVTLGDVNSPANDVIGLRLDLTLDKDALVPYGAGLSVNGSWCLDPTNLYTEVVPDASHHLSLLLRSADYSSQSGAGMVFTFRLIANASGFSAADLIDQEGGIVIVENIDVRLAAPQPNMENADAPNAAQYLPSHKPASSAGTPSAVQGHAFPNPTQGRVTLPLRMEAGTQAYLLAPDGQRHALPQSGSSDSAIFDLHEFPNGLYQLVIQKEGRPIYQERILKI